MVAGFPLTHTSYNQSVTLLKDRFGQPHKLIAAHMQALLHLSKPSNTLASLQLFHDSVEGHVRSLTSLGKPLDSYADMLLSVILEKLPGETRKHLARERTDGEWTFQSLQDAVLKEIRVFESVFPAISHTHSVIPCWDQKNHYSTSCRRPQEESLHILQGLPCPYRL